jgi:Holliday junction resolvasome RuvABC endonuclease subunit
VTSYAGFDPGLAAGFAVIERNGQRIDVLVCKAVHTKPSDPLRLRLHRIWNELSLVLRQHHPLVLCIEDQRQAQVAQAKREEFTADTSSVNQVVGLAKGCCEAYGVEYVEVSPARAKIALLGPKSGRASKDAVKTRVALMIGKTKFSRHGADAVALAMAGEQVVGRKRIGNA